MGATRTSSLAGVIALIATASFAADFPPPLPPSPQPIAVESGWYLRGFIGTSNEFVKKISHPAFLTAPQFQFLDKGGFESAGFWGLGVGYSFNNWLRFDITGEHRGAATFHALDRFFNDGMIATFNTNQYVATKTEWVGLVNAYVDLGTWWFITPFIGAGVGFANIKMDHFVDTNVIAGGGGWAPSGTKTNFAWALHAGLSYKVNPSFAIDLSYRYLNMGDGETGKLLNLDPTFPCCNTPPHPMTFKDIQSHDLMLGVRWMLQQDAAPAFPPPVVTKG